MTLILISALISAFALHRATVHNRREAHRRYEIQKSSPNDRR